MAQLMECNHDPQRATSDLYTDLAKPATRGTSPDPAASVLQRGWTQADELEFAKGFNAYVVISPRSNQHTSSCDV